MVINSKQAKATVVIILIILVFAVSFLAFNAKDVFGIEQPTWNKFNWNITTNSMTGYDFSSESIVDNCGSGADLCYNGGGSGVNRYISLYAKDSSKGGVKLTGASIKDCPNLTSYVSGARSVNIYENKTACIRTSDAYYIINATNFAKKGQFYYRSDIKWFEHIGELVCDDGKDGDNDGDIDMNDTDCQEINCTDSDEDGYNLTITGNCGPTDCNDSNSSFWQNLTGYVDSDEDKYGTGNIQVICSGATLPSGYANLGGDCNDSISTINPNATEVCGDGVDNDCVGGDAVCEACISGETQTCGVGACIGNQTCQQDETWGACDGSAPAAQENITNGIDDDCDGILAPNEADTDNDSFAIFEGDCNDANPNINPNAGENCMNGVDDNCNGEKDEGCSVVSSGGGGGGSSTRVTHTVGNGICEVGESPENACIDCGCLKGKVCRDNVCVLTGSAAKSAAGKIPPVATPNIAEQMTSPNPFPFLGMILVVLFSALLAGTGSYFFYYKPRESVIKKHTKKQTVSAKPRWTFE